jgi:hypothetical protein
MEKSNIIFENDNYIVQVGDSYEGCAGGKTYHVVNKFTNVIEREDSMWPSAVESAQFFDMRIKEHETATDTAEVVPISLN